MTAEPDPQSQIHWFLVGMRGILSLPAIIGAMLTLWAINQARVARTVVS